MKKGLNSLIILVSWEIWKHRTSCVFEGASQDIKELLQSVGLWGYNPGYPQDCTWLVPLGKAQPMRSCHVGHGTGWRAPQACVKHP